MSNDELKKELERLKEAKKEREERILLVKEINSLREEGTWKHKVKKGFGSVKEYLRKKKEERKRRQGL